jgi:predicted GNAT family N-acyltransferase
VEKITFKIVPYGSDDYGKSVALREEILRKPLGLSFTCDELEQEREHLHFTGYCGKELCATVLLVPEGQEVKMQRVAIKSSLQGRGIGSALMAFCEAYAQKQGYASIYCHARATAISFYLRNHHVTEGAPFEEDGIPHQKMRKLLAVSKSLSTLEDS